MAVKRLGFRPKLRDTQRANDLAIRHLAAMAGIDPPQELLNSIAPKRERAASQPSTEPTEREIQKAILDYLRCHPKVAWAHRFNRGVAQGFYNGRESYIQFNTCKGFADIHFLLKGGRAGYCEVKRPGKKATEEQAMFLMACTEYGALAFVASSVEEVALALR